jgi:hypothetical protein
MAFSSWARKKTLELIELSNMNKRYPVYDYDDDYNNSTSSPLHSFQFW